jgi:hypothetical protein
LASNLAKPKENSSQQKKTNDSNYRDEVENVRVRYIFIVNHPNDPMTHPHVRLLPSASALPLIDCFKQNHGNRRQDTKHGERGTNPENDGRKLLAALFPIADGVSFFH